ncbi:MAG: hypothetical protein Q4F23_05385 [Coriobacteriia bacterium]|nr:hypothetical protein [Coriobacteriia bacterium]
MKARNNKRLFRLVGVLVVFTALLLLALGIDACQKSVPSLRPIAVLAGGAVLEGDWLDGSIRSSDFVRSFVGADKQDVSADFAKEVYDPGKDGGAWVGSEGDVVGVEFTRPCDEALGQVVAELEEKGWTRVESGNDDALTFVKNEGVYGWVFVVAQRSLGGSCVAFTLVER